VRHCENAGNRRRWSLSADFMARIECDIAIIPSNPAALIQVRPGGEASFSTRQKRKIYKNFDCQSCIGHWHPHAP
jgi:hypothetical protein